MRCGATLGGISQSHVAVDSVDIGLPQLAMHSSYETIGASDIDNEINAFKVLYSLKLKIKVRSYKISYA